MIPDNPADWTELDFCWWFIGVAALYGVMYMLYKHFLKDKGDQ